MRVPVGPGTPVDFHVEEDTARDGSKFLGGQIDRSVLRFQLAICSTLFRLLIGHGPLRVN